MTDILKQDSLGSRKEIWELLERLGQLGRLLFLEWCCQQCRQTHRQHDITVYAANGHYETVDAVKDHTALCVQFGLNFDKSVERLIQLARKGK